MISHLPEALKHCVFQPHEESEFTSNAGYAFTDVDGSDVKPDNKYDGEAKNGHIPINEEHNENFDSGLWRVEINFISIPDCRTDNLNIYPED